MWVWEAELVTLGFRRSGRGACWVCRNRYGLAHDAHLALFDARRIHVQATRQRSKQRKPVLLDAFHVTWELGDQNIHFYYREQEPNVWDPEGHTPSGDIVWHGGDPDALRHSSDSIAIDFITALNPAGLLDPR